MSLVSGWNSVGLKGYPVTAVNTSEVAGFAYWDGTAYQTRSLTVDELNADQGARRGLWVFALAASTNLNYNANAVGNSTTTTDLRSGWNLLAFPASAPVPGNSLVVRSAGNVVSLGSVILPQFSEIQPDRTYRTVDVSAGGSLTPGRAYWVFASSAVSLSWGSGPSPSPTASPNPGVSPTPIATTSPSPTASPSPGSSPAASPTASASPAASPSPAANLTATRFTVSNAAAPNHVSSDGRYAVAIQGNSAPAKLQDIDLQSATSQLDTSSFINSNPVTSVASSDDCSRTVLIFRDGSTRDRIGVHQRSTNSTAGIDSAIDAASVFWENLDLSPDGNLCVFQSPSGANDVTFKNISTGAKGGYKNIYPGIATNPDARNLFLNFDGGGLSTDGTFLALEDRPAAGGALRYGRLNTTSGAYVIVLPTGTTDVSRWKLSGSGQFMVYQQGSPVAQIYIKDIDGGTPPELVSCSSAGDAGNSSSQLLRRCVSDNGRFVLFESDSTNLAAGVTSGLNLFLRDRLNGVTRRVNVDETGAQIARSGGCLSRNGQWVLFSGGLNTLLRVRNPAL